VSKRTIFLLKTLRGKTVKAVGTLRPPDRRFKQSRASATGKSAPRGPSLRHAEACAELPVSQMARAGSACCLAADSSPPRRARAPPRASRWSA